MSAEKHRLTVREVVQETGEAVSVVFERPSGLAYRPGQFLTLRLPHEDGMVARCYSLSSAPGVDEHLKITVKRVVHGRGSNWVCDNVSAGDELEVLGPSGTFTPHSLDTELLLLAGGSGITPVMSIIRSALARGSGRMLLVYANRDDRSVIFHEQLRSLVAEHADRLVVLHWLESVQGLPSKAPLQEIARPYAHGEAFICGPSPFMDCAAEALKELGVSRDRIHVERYASLAGDPWTEPDAAPRPEDEPKVALVVELDGEIHELSWPVGQTLLDFLLDEGLDAPYSCREGACSACSLTILEGEVAMANNSVLEQEELEAGWRLACQSHPISDAVRVSYDA